MDSEDDEGPDVGGFKNRGELGEASVKTFTERVGQAAEGEDGVRLVNSQI